jgi:hypothetical protein
MMKKIKFDESGNWMVGFESGHKTFDRQTNVIGQANMVANTMIGMYIRAYNDTYHWMPGEKNEPGHLQNYDLSRFETRRDDKDRIPKEMWEDARIIGMDVGLAAYIFYHHAYKGKGCWRRLVRVVHGFMLTDRDNNPLRIYVTGPTYKSERVMRAVAEFFGDPDKAVWRYICGRY